MNNSGTIVWNGKLVGTVANITSDMWYLDADWQSEQSEEALKFEHLAYQLKPEDVIRNPYTGIVATLTYDDAPSDPQNVLILSLSKSKIFMRLVTEEVVNYVDKKLLEPWQSTNNPGFFENELKRELSFFHPLNWKKVRAIGIRKDQDDVLFEVLNGKYKYAVVHLTYSKENSRRFPLTHLYKDWEAVYVNCILQDHKDWQEGQ